MLSIYPISSAAAAVSYFEKDDYYTRDGGEAGASGVWYGKGASALDLKGPVHRDVFKEVLEGRLPDGSTLGRVREGALDHRPGYDLTFSAPKSVSIAAEVGGDERLFAAHDHAVHVALDWLETNAAATRTLGFFSQLREERTENLVMALFQHDTSREHDPNLHTHSVVANATLRDDGKWRSIESKPLYHFMTAAGNIYRSVLAIDCQRYGYDITQTHNDGRFELAAIDPTLMTEFSQRRQQIESSLAALGLSGPVMAERAALMTRANKVDIDRSELEDDWKQRAGDRLQGIYDAVSQARNAGDRQDRTEFVAGKAVEKAVGRLAETEAVFTRAHLIRWGLAAEMGKTTIAELETAIDARASSGDLVRTSLGRRTAYTTPRARDLERRVTQAVRAGRSSVEPLTDRNHVQAIVRGTAELGKALTEGQEKALHMIATNRDRFVAVVGRPGTGKGFLMGRTRELLEPQGYVLVGAAQNAEAARVLQEESQIQSGTLARQLGRAMADLKKLQGGGSIEGEAIAARYEKQVWIVDEATQIDSAQMRRLTTAAEKLKFRVVLVGDPPQLGAIAAGKPFELMLGAGMRHVEMDEMRRQRHDRHQQAVKAAIAGDVNKAMEKLQSEIRERPDRQDRLAAILRTWERLGPERKSTLMLTAGNAEKSALNAGARDILRAEGKLAGEQSVPQLESVFSSAADRQEARFYQTGDVVRFGCEAKPLGIKSGEYLRVLSIDLERQSVSLGRMGADTPSDSIAWLPGQAGTGGKRNVEVFRHRDNTLAVGETIRWRQNNSGRKLNNGQSLTVVAIRDHQIDVADKQGIVRTLDPARMDQRHWEHAYASTVYSSQGGTAEHALVNAEASKGELFSQKAFLVAISRHRETITLFADDAQHFAENAIRHAGIKTSAIEANLETLRHGIEDRVSATLERMERLFTRPGPTANRELPQQQRERDRGIDRDGGRRNLDFER